MKKTLSILTVLILGASSALFASSPGTTAFTFLKINPSARSVGMGEVNSIVSAQTAMQNPSIAVWIESPEISVMHVKYFQDTSYSLIGYVYPFANESAISACVGALGVTGLTKTVVTDLGGSDLKERYWYQEKGDFEFSDKLVNIGYGAKVSRDMSIGGSVRYVQETIDTAAMSALMLSAGGFLQPWGSDWQFDFGFANFGSKYKDYDLPTNIYVGAGKQLYPYMYWGIDGVVYTDQIMEIRTGFEFNVSNRFFFRAGYKHLLEDQKLGELPMIDLTAGIGIQQKAFSFDYAWAPSGDLAQTHRISMGYRF